MQCIAPYTTLHQNTQDKSSRTEAASLPFTEAYIYIFISPINGSSKHLKKTSRTQTHANEHRLYKHN